jgi:hypothetical protein
MIDPMNSVSAGLFALAGGIASSRPVKTVPPDRSHDTARQPALAPQESVAEGVAKVRSSQSPLLSRRPPRPAPYTPPAYAAPPSTPGQYFLPFLSTPAYPGQEAWAPGSARTPSPGTNPSPTAVPLALKRTRTRAPRPGQGTLF